MYSHIMIPIDLANKDDLSRSIAVAADMAKHHDAKLTMVSISGGLQGEVSHSHAKFERKLAEFAKETGTTHEIRIDSINHSMPDPSVDMDKALLALIQDLRVDLVVMATHQPGWMDHLVNSHGGRLASYAPVSVFLVREAEMTT